MFLARIRSSGVKKLTPGPLLWKSTKEKVRHMYRYRRHRRRRHRRRKPKGEKKDLEAGRPFPLNPGSAALLNSWCQGGRSANLEIHLSGLV